MKLKITKDNLRGIFAVILTGLFCNFFFLVNEGIFWDDWCSIDKSFSSGSVGGIGFFEVLSLFNYSIIDNVICTRFFLFIAEVVGICFLFLSLNLFKKIQTWALYIALLAEVVPIYFARYSLCTFNYYISLSFFYIASYCYLKYLTYAFSNRTDIAKKIIFGIISVVFFIKSFKTSSFYAYYIVPFTFGFILLNGCQGLKIWKIENLKKGLKYLFYNFAFLVLPFIFFMIYKLTASPTGVYAEDSSGYNVIRNNFILESPYKFFDVFLTGLKDIIEFSLRTLFVNNLPLCFIMLFLLVAVTGLYLFLYRNSTSCYETNFIFFDFVICFIFIGFFAVFPYLAVGKIGRIASWTSRHLLCSGLSWSILFSTIIAIVTYKKQGIDIKFAKLLLLLVIIFFGVLRSYSGYKMYNEYFKQRFIIANLKQSEDVRKNEIFNIKWSSDFYLLNCESIRFYEGSCYAYKAFGTRNHLIYDEVQENLDFILSIKDEADWKISDVKRNEKDGDIFFTFYLSPKETLKCMFLNFTKRDKLDEYLLSKGTFKVELIGKI